MNTFQALYGPSFRVELFDFISDTGILDGLDVGTIWETPVRESIEAHSKTGELVLYAYVEEYAGMVEEILQSYEDKKLSFIRHLQCAIAFDTFISNGSNY